jgi:hypothetical protein
MGPVRQLARLQRLAAKRLVMLRTLVEQCAAPSTRKYDRIVSYVAIEALNLWTEFMRCYYLSCVLSGKRANGVRVKIATAGVRTVEDAINFAISCLRPYLKKVRPWRRRDEPSWHDPNTLLRLSDALGYSNLTEVRAAFAYPTRAFQDLPTVRNFFAHRNEETARKAVNIARSYGLSTLLRPSDILISIAPGRPQSVLSDWLDDIRYVIELLCQ